MKCQASIDIKGKHLVCDWPKEHITIWSHINEEAQILWGDNGISYPSKWVSYWHSLPDEMKPLVHIPHISRMNL